MQNAMGQIAAQTITLKCVEKDVSTASSTISGNSSVGDGGGIHNDGYLDVTGSTISGNLSGQRGGGDRYWQPARTDWTAAGARTYLIPMRDDGGIEKA
jgi:hypothetical protein